MNMINLIPVTAKISGRGTSPGRSLVRRPVVALRTE